jgi:hypothetical protein
MFRSRIVQSPTPSKESREGSRLGSEYVYTWRVNGFNKVAASEIDSCKRARIAAIPREAARVKSLRRAYRY